MPRRDHRSRLVATAALVVAALLSTGACGVRVYHPADGKTTGNTSGATTGAMKGAPAVGSCHDLTYDDLQVDSDDAPEVPCSARHTTLTVAVVPLTVDTDDEDRFEAFVQMTCKAAVARTVGGTADEQAGTIFGWNDFYPDDDEQKDGARWLRCDLNAVDGQAKPLPSGTGPFIGGRAPSAEYRYCLRLGTKTGVVTCDQPHDAAYRTSVESTAANGAYPGDDALKAEASRVCTSGGRDSYTWPQRESWERGERRLLCFR